MRVTGVGLILAAIIMGGLFSVTPILSQMFTFRSLFGLYAGFFVLMAFIFSSIKNDAAKEVRATDLMLGAVSGIMIYSAMPTGVPDYYAAGSALFVFAVMTTAFAGLIKK